MKRIAVLVLGACLFATFACDDSGDKMGPGNDASATADALIGSDTGAANDAAIGSTDTGTPMVDAAAGGDAAPVNNGPVNVACSALPVTLKGTAAGGSVYNFGTACFDAVSSACKITSVNLDPSCVGGRGLLYSNMAGGNIYFNFGFPTTITAISAGTGMGGSAASGRTRATSPPATWTTERCSRCSTTSRRARWTPWSRATPTRRWPTSSTARR